MSSRHPAGQLGASARCCRACLLGLGLTGLLLTSTTSVVSADVVTLAPDRDNTLFEDPAGGLSNGIGPVLFAGNNGQDLARRALLRFDIAGNLPHGARIDAVELRLNCSNATNATPRTFTLHRVIQEWGEGTSSTTSGSGAPAAPGDATWLHTFYSSSTWAAAGGDFAGAASATLSVGDVGVYTWTGAGLKADVQEWLNGTASNFGWLLFGEETALNTARRFDSRENTVAANRPALTVHYSFNTTGVGDPPEPVLGARLEPGYPNPTRGTFRVAFSLPSAATVQVVVDDVAGRRLATVAEGRFRPGRAEVVWNGLGSGGESLAPGLYFYRLFVAGRPVATRALARLR